MTATELKPLLSDGTARDERVRHYVENIKGTTLYEDIAICDAKGVELVQEHNGKICQKCIDILRVRGQG